MLQALFKLTTNEQIEQIVWAKNLPRFQGIGSIGGLQANFVSNSSNQFKDHFQEVLIQIKRTPDMHFIREEYKGHIYIYAYQHIREDEITSDQFFSILKEV